MAGETFEVTAPNLAAFDSALAGIGHDLGDLTEPVGHAAATTVTQAAAASPKLSGAMASAHRAGPGLHKASAMVSVATVYAAPQHWGWRAHGIARRPWVVAAFRRNPAWAVRFVDDLQTVLDRQAART